MPCLGGVYYIGKHIIPALKRVFELVGVDVAAWYEELPRVERRPFASFGSRSRLRQPGQRTISDYWRADNCNLCGERYDVQSNSPYCAPCAADPQRREFIMSSRLAKAEREWHQLLRACADCSGLPVPQSSAADHPAADCVLSCGNQDCGLLYTRHSSQAMLLRLKGAERQHREAEGA